MPGPQLPERSASSSAPLVDTSLRATLPGLFRVATTSAWRTVQWGVQTYTETTTRVLKAVAAGESPAQVVAEAVADLRATARHLLGIDEPASGAGLPGSPLITTSSSVVGSSSSRVRRGAATLDELRARGAGLLQDSADVWFEQEVHPAYERILDELSPDEARILRLLALEGPQPSIDIRTNRPLGVGSELVASGLSMIGLQAGVRYLDRTRADLNNLERLGLIWFSREPVADPSRYQVVEVQPDVLDAIKGGGRSPKTVHRSIHLTPFGEDFCSVCLPLGPSANSRP